MPNKIGCFVVGRSHYRTTDEDSNMKLENDAIGMARDVFESEF